MPRSPVQAEAIIRQSPGRNQPDMLLNSIADKSASNELSQAKYCHKFSEREEGNSSDAADIERSFTYVNDMPAVQNGRHDDDCATSQTHVFILVAIAPVEGWGSMRRIAGAMLEKAKFE